MRSLLRVRNCPNSGSHLIPIAQHDNVIPFDLRHHHYLRCSPNEEGLRCLRQGPSTRLRSLTDDDAPKFWMS